MIKYSDIFQKLVRLYADIPYRLTNGYAFPPSHVCFELTYRCNLTCEMCQFFQYADAKPSSNMVQKELTYDEVISIIDQFTPVTLITFTGGELFLRKDTMRILDYARRKRRFTVVTNGTTVTPEVADKLVGMSVGSLFGKGLVLVEVSIEGTEEVHESISKVKGSYKKTVSAIRHLVEARKKAGKKYPLFNMKTVIMPSNVGELSKLYGLATELGVDIFNPMLHSRLEVTTDKLNLERKGSIEISSPPPLATDTAVLESELDRIFDRYRKNGGPEIRFSPVGMTREEAVKYYKGETDMNQYSCRPPWYLMGISPYGEVTVCPYFSQGNVRDNTIMEIWNGAGTRNLRKMIKKNERFPGCFGCCNMTFNG